ncbi:hypothetical protein ACGFMK_20440 [Amycolatopsis sp. NPDC049252]|uniref:hypothetical protein n=1 Tax=Amycolatopsis sp. NPDC049252 TaxID=3363933 RepID=UPI00371D7194
MTHRPPPAADRPSNRDDSTRPPRTRRVNGVPYPGAPDPATTSGRPRRTTTNKAPRADKKDVIPPTVWTTGPEPIDPADIWPVPIIETITTSFSAAGARVLLAPWPNDAEHQTGAAELAAARDAVLALGREVDVVPLGRAAETSSLSRPFWAGFVTDSRDSAQPSESTDRTNDQSPAVGDPQAELIITTLPANCGADGSVETVALAAAQALTFGGILAVYTHSDWSTGRLTDPSGAMIAAAQNADLLYLQHVVILLTPIRNGQLQAPRSPVPDDGARTHTSGTSTSHVRAHGDVLIFAQAHADATKREDLR